MCRSGAWDSPSVTNSRAVSMAPRTSARSERLFCRLSVIEGNMCSQGYGWDRTENNPACGIRKAQFADPAAQSQKRLMGLQPFLHRLRIGSRDVIHLRIVAPPDRSDRVHSLLCATPSAIDVILVRDASTRPNGDLIMC